MRPTRAILAASICISLGAFGCTGSGGGTSAQSIKDNQLPALSIIGKMETFSSEDELVAYLVEQYAESALPEEAFEISLLEAEVLSETAELAEAATEESGDFTETNAQEPGVDESDKVKTDGTYFYIARERTVEVVKAVPADAMQKITVIEVRGTVGSIYLYNTTLVILFRPDNGLGEPWNHLDAAIQDLALQDTRLTGIGMPYWIPVRAKTGVLMVDVADPELPAITKHTFIHGVLKASRLTNGRLHLVQQFLPELPLLRLRYDGTDRDFQAANYENLSALEDITLDDLLPLYERIDSDGNVIESGRLVEPVDFYRPSDHGGGSIVTIITFDLEEPSRPFRSRGVIADIHTIYASTKALYLAGTRWNYDFSTLDLLGIRDDLHEKTVIHKFNISEEEVTLGASGAVWGRILNQFSLGEYEGILRVATTTVHVGDALGTTHNHVFCLEAVEGDLKVIGKLVNLAPGERIYAARFLRTRGFLVTFNRIDPLFTLDLADPTKPIVAGELKVPGYSTYIHPMGENYIITIGKDASVQGGRTVDHGVQLSVFDVTDLNEPRLLHKELIGVHGTTSEALFNHKAFTFWDEKGLLSIPIILFEHDEIALQSWDPGRLTFIGLYVYGLTVDEGFDLLGRISTVRPNDLLYSYYSAWTRGIFIDENVYAVLRNAVHSAEVEDIENTIHTLILSN